MKQYIIGLMALAIGSFLFTNANVYVYAVPSSSDLESLGNYATGNADMLDKITQAVIACTNQLQSYDYSNFDACYSITNGYNDLLTVFLAQHYSDLQGIGSPYSYSRPSLFGNGLPS